MLFRCRFHFRPRPAPEGKKSRFIADYAAAGSFIFFADSCAACALLPRSRRIALLAAASAFRAGDAADGHTAAGRAGEHDRRRRHSRR